MRGCMAWKYFIVYRNVANKEGYHFRDNKETLEALQSQLRSTGYRQWPDFVPIADLKRKQFVVKECNAK